MSERVSSTGYVSLKKQSSPTVAVTPDTYTPYYKQNVNTDIHMMEDNPVYGNKFKDLLLLPGRRTHGGSLTVMAEPDTAARWFDMLLTKGSTTGSDPYTHPFTLSGTDPNFYTMDISYGSQVVRFVGVGASKITPTWQDDEMQFDIDVSALSSFYGREIASISTTVVTLKTDYDSVPTHGLVAGDLVKVTTVDGSSTLNTTISSLTDTTVTLGASAAAFAAGDMLLLRPATPSLSIKTPFLWPKTEFRFGDDASAALSATQTRLEKGSDIAVMHMFESNDGSPRSGGFDPAALVRTQGDVTFKVKKFFDTPEEIREWNAVTKKAVVMRSFSETGYELRITVSSIAPKTNDMATESGGVNYHEIEYGTAYGISDGQGMDVKVINSVATI